jgi:signal transduction histidine kinase
LRITVADTGAGLSTAEYSGGDGVGLSNIRSRLAALYGGRGRLTLCANAPHGVVATIDVPLRIDWDGASEGEREQVSQTAADPRAPVTAV